MVLFNKKKRICETRKKRNENKPIFLIKTLSPRGLIEAIRRAIDEAADELPDKVLFVERDMAQNKKEKN